MENTKKQNTKKQNTKKQNTKKKPSLLNTIRSIPEAWRTRKSTLSRQNLLKRSEGRNNSNIVSTIPSKTINNTNNINNINNTNINIPKSPYSSSVFRKRTTRKQKRYNRKK
jgi:hypothetical protein